MTPIVPPRPGMVYCHYCLWSAQWIDDDPQYVLNVLRALEREHVALVHPEKPQPSSTPIQIPGAKP